MHMIMFPWPGTRIKEIDSTTKKCTYQDSISVLECEHFLRDWIDATEDINKWIVIEFWHLIEISLVGLYYSTVYSHYSQSRFRKDSILFSPVCDYVWYTYLNCNESRVQ